MYVHHFLLIKRHRAGGYIRDGTQNGLKLNLSGNNKCGQDPISSDKDRLVVCFLYDFGHSVITLIKMLITSRWHSLSISGTSQKVNILRGLNAHSILLSNTFLRWQIIKDKNYTPTRSIKFVLVNIKIYQDIDIFVIAFTPKVLNWFVI